MFGSFAIPRSLFAEPPAVAGKVSFSLRPQSIHLYRQAPAAADGRCLVTGHVAQRAYLGEHWDYTVRPEGTGVVLRVTARPHEVFETDDTVWLELDPGQMAPIQD